MKSIKNIKLLMSVGLLLHVGIALARYNDEQVQNMLSRINEQDRKSDYVWEPTAPTLEDILASKRVDNLAAKGSREENLINAAKNGDHKNIATLIAAGTGLEAKDDQDRTALMRAAEKGYSEVVKILLDAGAEVSTKDKFGWTALFMAADKNHVEVVKILIARGAASDENFEDIFVSSAFKGNTEMVKALVGDGAHINCDTIDAARSVVDFRKTEMFKIIEHLKSQCNSSETDDSEEND